MSAPSAAHAHIDDLADFVTASPTSYHASADAVTRLAAAGFVEIDETAPWTIERGGSYVTRRDGAVIAFRIPAGATATTPFSIVGTHTDSPGFRLKPQPSTAGRGGWRQLGAEIYGGPILSTWFDRDLRVAGRLVTRDGESVLVSSEAIARIPNLAIHLDRSANDAITIDRQRHTQPVWGFGGDSSDVLAFLAEPTGLSAADIAGYDLFLADAQPPAKVGADRTLFASGRLDNLLSTHAAITAIAGSALDAETAGTIPVVAAFDHEEVGSATRSGAGGTFLESVLTRIGISLGSTAEERLRSWSASMHVSSDVGHAVHPNYSEKHDPTVHPVVGAGPIIKINANQRYASDGVGEAAWNGACDRAGVPTQAFVSNNSIPCGSTIGPITATRLGIATVDVGAAILSMHSIRELAAVVDPWYLSRAMVAFFAR